MFFGWGCRLGSHTLSALKKKRLTLEATGRSHKINGSPHLGDHKKSPGLKCHLYFSFVVAVIECAWKRLDLMAIRFYKLHFS